ncbi:MAG: type II secretion system protein M [Bdellovibrionales bacterium]|nr:type II secretion system protein M [Bdellovibrionales bacterium]
MNPDQPLKQRIIEWYQGISTREQYLIFLMVGIALSIGGYSLVEESYSSFTNQSQNIRQAKETLEQLSALLPQYVRLQHQKKEIESRFEGGELRMGIRSYIEDLATKKAAMSTRPTIQQINTEPFGDNFELTKISVSFNTQDPAELIQFLKEIDKSEHPIILSRLEVRRLGSRLSVQTKLSSISRQSKPSPSATS